MSFFFHAILDRAQAPLASGVVFVWITFSISFAGALTLDNVVTSASASSMIQEWFTDTQKQPTFPFSTHTQFLRMFTIIIKTVF